MTDEGRSAAGVPLPDRSITSGALAPEPVRASRAADPPGPPLGGNRLVERTSARLYLLSSSLIGRLPARPAWTVLGWFTRASYLLIPSKRRWSNQNFGHVLGKSPDSPAVRQLALEAYGTYARYLVELMGLPRLKLAEAAARIDGVGLDEVEAIWRDSKGIILVASHVGNNEIACAGVAQRGWPISVVADDSTFPELFEILRQQREKLGARVIPYRNLREVYGVLRRRELLTLLVDWGYRADGIPVRLFGAWTTLPAGPAALAAKTGASILPVTIRRQPNDHFLIEVNDVFRVPSSQPADLLEATQAIAASLERTIGAAPEQWYSFKPMWPATEVEARELERRAARMAANES
jgi:phosphatidylinositol dimannoside acyltransferase